MHRAIATASVVSFLGVLTACQALDVEKVTQLTRENLELEAQIKEAAAKRKAGTLSEDDYLAIVERVTKRATEIQNEFAKAKASGDWSGILGNIASIVASVAGSVLLVNAQRGSIYNRKGVPPGSGPTHGGVA